MEYANVDYFYKKCNRILGTSYSNDSDRIINIEWLTQAVRSIYISIHKPKAGCRMSLSSSFSSNARKAVVDIKLVDTVVDYLKNFNKNCVVACNCVCDCSMNYACNCDCGECSGNSSGQSKDCPCNCDCNRHCDLYECHCTTIECSACAPYDSYNCSSVPNCNCTHLETCDCPCNCDCGDCERTCNCGMCGVGFCDCDCDCFITTAICKSFNKPDNCYELTIFRKFRDNWLKKQPDGESLINEYYNIAPIIVQKIDKSPNKDEIYFLIWEKWLKPCLNSIEEGMFDKCKFLYISMVNELRKIYV